MDLRSKLCCVILWGVVFSSGSRIPKFNFSLSSLQNDTGEWYGEVRLSHEGKQPWEVYVDHTTLKINGTETVAFVAKIIPPTVDEHASIVENRKKETPMSPPLGYMKLHGFGYYKIFTQLVNWTEAVKICEKEGTHLFILNSDAEARTISRLIKRDKFHWSGFHDLYVEGRIVTIFNKTLDSTGYTEWYYGRGNSHSDNCGGFIYDSYNKYGLRMISCASLRPFICKQEYSAFQSCITTN